MTVTKLKLIAVTVVAAAVGTPLVMQHRANEALRAENTALRERAAELTTLRAENRQLAGQMEAVASRPQAEHLELLRLRGEVGVLRQQLAEMAQAKAAAPAAHSSDKTAGYLATDQLAYAGFATPEAAIESAIWALVQGDYDITQQAMSLEMRNKTGADLNDRANFETATANLGTMMQGIQILAKKTLAEDQVEMKVRMDGPNSGNPGADGGGSIFIQPMVKVGNEWKLGGGSRGVPPDWDETGQVQAESP